MAKSKQAAAATPAAGATTTVFSRVPVELVRALDGMLERYALTQALRLTRSDLVRKAITEMLAREAAARGAEPRAGEAS